MKILLIDTNKNLCDEWIKIFKDSPQVEIFNDDFRNHSADCLVSPANSFGFMDGGIDLAISNFFNWPIGKGTTNPVKDEIKYSYNGELLVGQSLIVETDNEQYPYLLSAPTMRVPMVIDQTANPYLAMKAIMRLAVECDFNSIVIPGLGTLTGRVSPERCALQMYHAYKCRGIEPKYEILNSACMFNDLISGRTYL